MKNIFFFLLVLTIAHESMAFSPQSQSPSQQETWGQPTRTTRDGRRIYSSAYQGQFTPNVAPSERFDDFSSRIASYRSGGFGQMESCGSVPGSVSGALYEAQQFRRSCSLANRGDDKKIAINDYSGNGIPYMYVFDTSGNCLMKTAITYGMGNGRQRAVSPNPCSGSGQKMTPPGMHLTGTHNGALYKEHNSVGLVGLEGQQSVGRGVIMHPAEQPGTASSWGCTGIGYSCFQKIKETLGVGSLVYNYFGSTGVPRNCSNEAGASSQRTVCQADRGGAGKLAGLGTRGSPRRGTR